MHRRIPRLALSVALTCSLLGPVRAPAADRDDPRRPARGLEAAWVDLASGEEAVAARAILTFAARADEGTAFLGSHLKPLKLDDARLRKSIAGLADANPKRRKEAEDEIEALGPLARRQLEEALAGELPVAANQWIRDWLRRMPADEDAPAGGPQPFGGGGGNVSVSNNNGHVTITVDGKTFDLDNLNKPAGRAASPHARALRSLALLEHYGTPRARAIVESMADGEPTARPTKEARAILARWKPVRKP